MTTLDEAADIALGLPHVSEGLKWGNRTWTVNGTGFAWERPLSKADIKRWNDGPVPRGELLAVNTGDLSEKAAILAQYPGYCFTIQHFDNYPAVLIHLESASPAEVKDLLVQAWEIANGAPLG